MNIQNTHAYYYQRGIAKLRILGCVVSLSILAACGGSGAGDDDNDQTDTPDAAASMAVEPFVGVWELPGNWRGENNDEARLLIKPPANDGTAEAIIFDFDDAETGLGQNCYRTEFPGKVSQSFGNGIFLDIGAFPDGQLSLNAAGDLVIVFTDGVATTTDRDTITLIATPLGITETDLAPLC